MPDETPNQPEDNKTELTSIGDGEVLDENIEYNNQLDRKAVDGFKELIDSKDLPQEEQGKGFVVQRTDGRIENDWILARVMEDKNAVSVVKFDENGRGITKLIPVDEFAKWQVEEINRIKTETEEEIPTGLASYDEWIGKALKEKGLSSELVGFEYTAKKHNEEKLDRNDEQHSQEDAVETPLSHVDSWKDGERAIFSGLDKEEFKRLKKESAFSFGVEDQHKFNKFLVGLGFSESEINDAELRLSMSGDAIFELAKMAVESAGVNYRHDRKGGRAVLDDELSMSQSVPTEDGLKRMNSQLVREHFTSKYYGASDELGIMQFSMVDDGSQFPLLNIDGIGGFFVEELQGIIEAYKDMGWSAEEAVIEAVGDSRHNRNAEKLRWFTDWYAEFKSLGESVGVKIYGGDVIRLINDLKEADLSQKNERLPDYDPPRSLHAQKDPRTGENDYR